MKPRELAGDEMRLLHVHAGAFAVGDARVDLEGGRLGALGQRDRFLGRDAATGSTGAGRAGSFPACRRRPGRRSRLRR